MTDSTIKLLDLDAQRRRTNGRLEAAMRRVVEHGRFILGPEVAEFEQAIATYCGARHAISCANGTDALILALMALEVGEGDAVFAPSFTFVATVEAIRIVGATPVFVDVRPDTFNVCPDSLLAAIGSVEETEALRPRAIVPVDLFGQPADYRAINRLAEERGLVVIADAAQSFGASLDNRQVGRFGDITTTSFFPAKPLGCYGDGGCLFSDDDDSADLLRSLRNHGAGGDRYDNVRLGLNSRLDTLQAAVLSEKLKILPEELERRDELARRYTDALAGGFATPALIPGARSAWAQYTIHGDRRDEIRDRLAREGVPTAVYYPRPNHLQPPYRDCPRAPGGLPNTEHLRDRVFSLPIHPYLSASDQDFIIDALKEAARP